MRQGLMVRRPVFPPSEHSSLSRKGSKGFAPGEHDTGKGISMPLYEHVFLTRQDASAQQVEELTAQFTGIFEQMGGKVVKTEQWGVKSLSYRLRKNRKAHFTLFNVDAPSAALNEVERQERLSEDVLRYITVRVDEHEEGPSAMMRKVDRDRERDDRGFGFRDRDRGSFRDRDRDRGEHRRDRDGRPPREGGDETPTGNEG
jgi:small subunit ribosomal protein S6